MCTAFAITEENSVELAWLIEAHHEALVKLYGKERVTPKMPLHVYTLPPSVVLWDAAY